MHKRFFLLSALLVLGALGGFSQTVTALSGGGQRTTVSTAFPNPFVAIVTDSNGNPISGFNVTFTGSGLDSSQTYSATTGADGTASVTLYANSTPGAYTVTAAGDPDQMASFSARQGNQSSCSQNISVNSALDSGAGTLRTAINEVCTGGTIDLSGLGSTTISLASRLYLGSDMTIQGGSASPVTLDGGSATRILFVQDGNITLTNLILAHGVVVGAGGSYGGAAAGMGGAIFQNGGTLSLSNVSLHSNSVMGGSWTGYSTYGGSGFGGVGEDPNTGGSGGDLGGAPGNYYAFDSNALPGGDGGGGSRSTLYCYGCNYAGIGGFGAGGGGGYYPGAGGFGGGAGLGSNPNSFCCTNGGWGGNGSTEGSGANGGGAGGGLGGAIFLRRGLLNLSNVSFSGNQAHGGNSNPGTIATDAPGQGKGAGLFIFYGAFVNASNVTYANDVAPDAGTPSNGESAAPYTYQTTCPGVDTVDICGAVTPGNKLTVSVAGGGLGTVSSGPVAFDTIYCPGLCSMVGNGQVTLTPTAQTGSQFSSWSGACTGSGSCVVSLASANQSVTANFIGNYGTTTTAANSSTPYSTSSQNVPLSASVTSSNGTINVGTVTFTVAGVGTVTSGTVSNGQASALLTVPAGTAANTYAISAAYNPGGLFATSTDTSHALTITPVTPQITWNAPANLTYGSALGSGQLDATANVAGTFSYTPPAGTVLPVGNQQTLAVQFTPTDNVDYQSASGSTTINVVPAVTSSPVSIIVTNVLSRSSGNIVVTLTISNNGGTAANNVTLTTVKVGSTVATPLPQSLGTIAGGSSIQTTVSVPGTVGNSGAGSSLSISGTYTGGSFSSNSRITLP